MYKKDLALNNLQWLICHKLNQNKNVIYKMFTYTNAHMFDLCFCIGFTFDNLLGRIVGFVAFLKLCEM